MKRKILPALAILAICLLIFPSCEVSADDSSVKSITKPYIAQYECTQARLGTKDILEDFDYIKIIMLSDNELELQYKSKGGRAKSFTGNYSIDTKTRELKAEIGILGFKYKESVIVENGKFTISKPINGKEFSAQFKAM